MNIAIEDWRVIVNGLFVPQIAKDFNTEASYCVSVQNAELTIIDIFGTEAPNLYRISMHYSKLKASPAPSISPLDCGWQDKLCLV